jgi:hypothetical protein
MPNGVPPNPALEAYKLEYQLAATRYENIYKAIWQIFSYLAAVTGALLTFGGDHFQQNLLWVLASVPLFFWFLSTYLPMDRYGHQCLERLAKIEEEINVLSGSAIKHYVEFNPKGLLAFLRSVRFPVYVVGIVLGFVFTVNGYKTLRILCRNEPLILKKSDDRPISLTADELKKLLGSTSCADKTPSIPQTPDLPKGK